MYLLNVYHQHVDFLKREYDVRMKEGKDMEMLVRLIRLKYEREDVMSVLEREEGKKWIDDILTRRKDNRDSGRL